MNNMKIEQFGKSNQTDITNLIQEQQEQCAEYVTKLSKEQIGELLDNKHYFFIKNDDKVVASGYRLPLLDNVDEEEQIYRLGGLSILDFKSSSIENKKAIILLLKEIKQYFEEKNSQLIMKTENPVLARVLKDMGAEELTFEKCLEKYPKFLRAYIDKSEKPVEYYKTQTFYIRSKK